jgi:hypothetical protein
MLFFSNSDFELAGYLSISEYLKLPVEERMRRSLPLSKSEEDRASELRGKLLFIDIHNHVVQTGDRVGYQVSPGKEWNDQA